MPSAVSTSSFSLVARDLRKTRAGVTVLEAVDVAVGPRTRLGVVGPNGVGKTTLLRLLAGLDRPDRGSIVAAPPSLRVGYLPQEPERSLETLTAFLARRTGVAAAEAELERGGRGAGDRERRRHRGGRLRRRPRRLPRCRRTRSRRPLPERPRRRGVARAPAGRPHRCALGRRGGARVVGRDPAEPLRRVPPRRADQRPRLRGLAASGAVPRRPAGWRGGREP